MAVPIRKLDCGCYYGERTVICPSHQPDVTPAPARYRLVAYTNSPSHAAEWAERMILSDRSVKVERKVNGSFSLFCMDDTTGLREWREVIGC